MRKLTIRLKQHTPLIHFQGIQSGATIRATDIKPRLDRWLMDYEFGGISNFTTYKSYIQKDLLREIKVENPKSTELKKAKLAFDYALSVKCAENMEYIPINGNQTANGYFGTMEKKDSKSPKPIKYLVYPSNLEEGYHVLLSFRGRSEILEVIKKHAVDFFMQNNFMTRQSKGYGCFTVVDIDGVKVETLPTKTNYFSYSPDRGLEGVRIFCDERTGKKRSLFNHIDLFYRSIRSGINLKDMNGNTSFYFKSVLFRYLHEKGFQWDKKTMKSYFLDEHETNSFATKKGGKRVNYIKHQAAYHKAILGTVPDILDDFEEIKKPPQQRDFRDRLGLSSLENYFSYQAQLNKEMDDKNKVRIPSPILIKPIFLSKEEGFRIYILVNELVENQMPKGEKITLKFIQKDLEQPRTNLKREITLQLADENEFSLKDYLKYIETEGAKIAGSIMIDGPDREGMYLRDIYNQLHKNAQ